MNRFLIGLYLVIVGSIGYSYHSIGSLIIILALFGCFCELYFLTESYLICFVFGTIWFGPTIITIIFIPHGLIIKTAILVSTFDIFQYLIGKYFGKLKYIPISPNKTIEGYIGGYILSLILSYVIKKNFLVITLLYTMGILGDLFASWVKRVYCVKDFSNALGDHGGFIDRLDSIFFVTPLLFFIKV